ncbi:neuropeptide FF receptor 2 [Nematostella vectensis]|uniref:neuropeptide FF receptor 2 n=1 Tax=Nematostella vectensis TaxID=45351 RepID=UPI002076E597|nr:neuropeptide FF receptor 2 [Nematostella vectensis]
MDFNSSNASINGHDCPQRRETQGEIAAKFVAYSVVLVVALMGNVLVIWVVHRSPGMRQKTINMFIVNLSIADLLMALFTIPRLLSEIVSEQGMWLVTGLLGEALCKLTVFIQEVATAVSIQCVVILAYDRFRAVVYPLHSATMSTASRVITIPVTWLIACILHSPDFYTYHLEVYQNRTYCIYQWSEDQQLHFQITRNYYLALFCILALLPAALLVVLYSAICYTLVRHGQLAKIRTSIANMAPTAYQKRKEQEHNVMRMAGAIVIGFALCYGPFNTFVFFRIFVWDFWSPCGIEAINFIAPFLLFSNSALNPILYFAFSENFRHGICRVFSRKPTGATSSSRYCIEGMKKAQTVEDRFVELELDSTFHQT